VKVNGIPHLLLILIASCGTTDALAHSNATVSCTLPSAPFSEWPSAGGSRSAKQVTIKHVEQANLKDAGSGKLLPFGRWNPHWVSFKSAFEPGDSIYETTEIYNGPPNLFVHGFLLVRRGCVIRKLVADVLS